MTMKNAASPEAFLQVRRLRRTVVREDFPGRAFCGGHRLGVRSDLLCSSRSTPNPL